MDENTQTKGDVQANDETAVTAEKEGIKVVVYSTPTCHFCHLVKDFFKENNVAYVEYDVAADVEKRAEMVEKTGQMGVPVVFIGDDYVVGFNESRIKELLGME